MSTVRVVREPQIQDVISPFFTKENVLILRAPEENFARSNLYVFFPHYLFPDVFPGAVTGSSVACSVDPLKTFIRHYMN